MIGEICTRDPEHRPPLPMELGLCNSGCGRGANTAEGGKASRLLRTLGLQFGAGSGRSRGLPPWTCTSNTRCSAQIGRPNAVAELITDRSVHVHVMSVGLRFLNPREPWYMVKSVEDAIKVDRQGRLVLPSDVRKAFGIKDGGEVTIRIDGSRVILEPVRTDVKKSVQEWEDLSRSLNAEVFTDEASESWKWMSREYARRKLGLS